MKMATQLGKLIHVLDNNEFEVGEIVKIGPSKYAKIISKEEYLEDHPCVQHQDKCLPVITMDGKKKLINVSQILVVKDPKNEYDALKENAKHALDFLRNKKAS